MKVDKIIPCICCEHEPNSGDSVYYGMPQLKVCVSDKKEHYTAFCPNCGRGGAYKYNSARSALKDWNELQESLRVGRILIPLVKNR